MSQWFRRSTKYEYPGDEIRVNRAEVRMKESLMKMPWVVVRLCNNLYAVSVESVREIVAMPETTSMPDMPKYIRGITNLRDGVFPVIDMRLRMGMSSLKEESQNLIELLNQREQDHKNWIEELESSVRERRPFNLATDPHQCAFGKWYDNFTTSNSLLAYCLARFDAPHQKIHGIAIKVKALEAAGEFDAAYALLDQTRHGELEEMIRLFSETRSMLQDSNREIALILESDNRILAAAVDSIEAVEKLTLSDVQSLPDSFAFDMDKCFVGGIGRSARREGIIQLIDADSLVNQPEAHELAGV